MIFFTFLADTLVAWEQSKYYFRLTVSEVISKSVTKLFVKTAPATPVVEVRHNCDIIHTTSGLMGCPKKHTILGTFYTFAETLIVQ